MIRALILDDEPLARRYLRELLEGQGVVVVADVGTTAEAEQVLAAHAIDVAFVDIRLVERPGDRSGLDWLLGLVGARSEMRPPSIVLATALPDHALAAFDAGAVDYLLKPFTSARVATCIERLMQRRAAAVSPPAPAPTRLLARTRAGVVLLPIDGILAFEAAERLTYVHHGRERFPVDPSLAALETTFGTDLMRTHRNWLVWIASVRELLRQDGELVLRVGEAGLIVPVARDRAAAVRAAVLRSAR